MRWAWRRETAPGVAPGNAPTLAENRLPDIFRIRQHGRYEAGHGVVCRWALRGACCTCAGMPPPLSRPRIVSGLMPSTQPPSRAITMVPMPMLRPPNTGMPPPPPLPRRSSTLSDSRLPSHFMLLLPAPRHHAGYGLDIRPSSRRSIRRKGLIGKQRYARLPPRPVPDSGFCTAAAPEACIKCDHADHASCRPFCRAPIHEGANARPGQQAP